LGIIGGGITIPGRFIGNAMSGYEGRRRRVGRRTGAHGRRIIGRGRGRNRDDRITVGDFGRNRGGQTMVEDSGRSPDDLTMARGLGHNLVGRIMVEDPGRSRVDLTMARGLGRSRVGRIMVEDFDRGLADRTMARGPDRNLGDRTTVGGRGLSRADRTMVRGRDRNRDGQTVGRDLNLIGRIVGHGLNLRGLTMVRDRRRRGPVVGVARAGRQPGSRARLLLIGAPSPPTRATNVRNRSDRCGSFRHRVSVWRLTDKAIRCPASGRMAERLQVVTFQSQIVHPGSVPFTDSWP
jgi:hypothetical protein